MASSNADSLSYRYQFFDRTEPQNRANLGPCRGHQKANENHRGCNFSPDDSAGKRSLELYDFYTQQIEACDAEMDRLHALTRPDWAVGEVTCHTEEEAELA